MSQASPSATPSLSAVYYLREEFSVGVGGRQLSARLVQPEAAQLAPSPLLLLSLALDVETSLNVEPYNIAGTYFLEQGHRVVSFDLPSHGQRIDEHGEGITGFRNAFVQGEDRFAAFMLEARAIVDHCIVNGWAEPGQIVVCGTSRAGYLGLRLLSQDDRIAAGAAFAPVTDWCMLSEFVAEREQEAVAALRLSNYADALVGKPVFAIIGNQDERVSTASCCQFYVDLVQANASQGLGTEHINFQVADVPGHSSAPEWYVQGAKFLIEQASVANA
jgi:pimeloyl-ACP methyl ester carboxylesterase